MPRNPEKKELELNLSWCWQSFERDLGKKAKRTYMETGEAKEGMNCKQMVHNRKSLPDFVFPGGVRPKKEKKKKKGKATAPAETGATTAGGGEAAVADAAVAPATPGESQKRAREDGDDDGTIADVATDDSAAKRARPLESEVKTEAVRFRPLALSALRGVAGGMILLHALYACEAYAELMIFYYSGDAGLQDQSLPALFP